MKNIKISKKILLLSLSGMVLSTSSFNFKDIDYTIEESDIGKLDTSLFTNIGITKKMLSEKNLNNTIQQLVQKNFYMKNTKFKKETIISMHTDKKMSEENMIGTIRNINNNVIINYHEINTEKYDSLSKKLLFRFDKNEKLEHKEKLYNYYDSTSMELPYIYTINTLNKKVLQQTIKIENENNNNNNNIGLCYIDKPTIIYNDNLYIIPREDYIGISKELVKYGEDNEIEKFINYIENILKEKRFKIDEPIKIKEYKKVKI